jgi:hypothetical protein
LGEFWVGTILDPLEKFKVDTLQFSKFLIFELEINYKFLIIITYRILSQRQKGKGHFHR